MSEDINYQLLGPCNDQNAENLLKDCADNQEACTNFGRSLSAAFLKRSQ